MLALGPILTLAYLLIWSNFSGTLWVLGLFTLFLSVPYLMLGAVSADQKFDGIIIGFALFACIAFAAAAYYRAFGFELRNRDSTDASLLLFFMVAAIQFIFAALAMITARLVAKKSTGR